MPSGIHNYGDSLYPLILVRFDLRQSGGKEEKIAAHRLWSAYTTTLWWHNGTQVENVELWAIVSKLGSPLNTHTQREKTLLFLLTGESHQKEHVQMSYEPRKVKAHKPNNNNPTAGLSIVNEAIDLQADDWIK